MSFDARQVTFARPTAVAIHDHRNVLRQVGFDFGA
jgi:hypothetical protein